MIAFINEEATRFINEEAIGAVNEAAVGDIISPWNLPSCFFISSYTVSVAPSINRLDFSGDSTILKPIHYISFIWNEYDSFEMNSMNPFPVLTAPFPLSFYQIYLIQTKLL